MTRDELAKISVRRVACLAGGLSGVLNAKITTETAVMRLVKSKYTTYMTYEFMKENTLRKAAKSTNAEHNPLPSLKHSSRVNVSSLTLSRVSVQSKLINLAVRLR